jgi:hypothetical protein
VESFDGPVEAGMWVNRNIAKEAVVLAKGSQNGVFAEEALKVLLYSSNDSKKLVRQNRYWMRRKQAFFDTIKR